MNGPYASSRLFDEKNLKIEDGGAAQLCRALPASSSKEPS